VESKPGAGSSFSFVLRAIEEESQRDHRTAAQGS
jgi:hypothetical protein